MKSNSDSDIPVFDSVDAVRKRPLMYLWGGNWPSVFDGSFAYHLLFQTVRNSVEQAELGLCSRITVTLHPDNRFTVEDNGPGISCEPFWERDLRPTVEVYLLQHYARGAHKGRYWESYPPGEGYRYSGGLHPPGGLKLVNAFSKNFSLETFTPGKHAKLYCEKGRKVGDIEIKAYSGDKLGTRIDYSLDEEALTTDDVSSKLGPERSMPLLAADKPRIAARLHAWASLYPKLTISLHDLRNAEDSSELIAYPTGIAGYAQFLAGPDNSYFPPFNFRDDALKLEVSLVFTQSRSSRLVSFVGNHITGEGGPHLHGFLDALHEVFSSRKSKYDTYISRIKLLPEDILPGVCAVISIKIHKPGFSSSDYSRLIEDEGLQARVKAALVPALVQHLNQHPELDYRYGNDLAGRVYQRVKSGKSWGTYRPDE